MKTVQFRSIVLAIFLWCSVPFALMSVAFARAEGITRWWTVGISEGLVFGGVMALTLGGLLHLWMRRAGYDAVPAVEQSVDVVVKVDVMTATRAATAALGLLKPRSVVVSGTGDVRITASTRMTWKSFGERIEICVLPLGEGRSTLHLSTRPLVRSTIVDYGKGLNNLDRLTASLSGLPSWSSH